MSLFIEILIMAATCWCLSSLTSLLLYRILYDEETYAIPGTKEYIINLYFWGGPFGLGRLIFLFWRNGFPCHRAREINYLKDPFYRISLAFADFLNFKR